MLNRCFALEKETYKFFLYSKFAYLFVTPGAIFGEAGRKYIRITLCTPEETLREATARVKAKYVRK